MKTVYTVLADGSRGIYAVPYAVSRLEEFAAVDWGTLTKYDREILATAVSSGWEAAVKEAAKYYSDPEESLEDIVEDVKDITVRHSGVDFHIEINDNGDVLLVSEPVPTLVALSFLHEAGFYVK